MKNRLSLLEPENYKPIFNIVKSFNHVISTKSFLLLIPLLAYGCGTGQPEKGEPAPTTLPIFAISASKQTVFQEYPAAIEGISNVEIRPQVGGILEDIYVDEGAEVKKGQLLFKIDALPYREQLNQALANLHAAEAALEHAALEVEKKNQLVSNKVLAHIQLQTALASRNVAKANLEQAEASVSSAKINLGYTLIKAPVDGYIGRLLKKQGSLVGPSDQQPLTELSDIHDLHVYFSLGENDFINFKSSYAGNTLEDKIKNLPPVTLLLSDHSVYPDSGKIDMIDGQFDKNTGAITFRATFPNKRRLLRSGNTGKIRLGKEHNNVLMVPQEATLEMQDKVFVYTVDQGNKVSKKPIQIAGKSGGNYLVKSGLKEGDRIVYKGMDRLQEGQVISPRPISSDSLKITALNH